MASNDDNFEGLFRKKFGRSPRKEEMNILIDQSVKSFNQLGGITAHTVNIAPPKRILNDAVKHSLITNLPRDRVIKVDAPFGDGEAIQFAESVLEFLESQGFNMSEEGLIQSMRVPAPKGQGIDVSSEVGVATVIIGHQIS